MQACASVPPIRWCLVVFAKVCGRIRDAGGAVAVITTNFQLRGGRAAHRRRGLGARWMRRVDQRDRLPAHANGLQHGGRT
jgi:hypothetical protein